jgi:hypothetical protein
VPWAFFRNSEGTVVKATFDGDFITPCGYSVQKINAKACPWLRHVDKNIEIWAGCTITEFTELVQKAGGTVYTEHKEE